MEFDGKIWTSMTWERVYMRYVGSEPVLPYILQKTCQKAISCNVLDCAYLSDTRTGRVFLMSEPDEDDEEEGPWSHEYLCKGEMSAMHRPSHGSVSMVRVRFSGR